MTLKTHWLVAEYFSHFLLYELNDNRKYSTLLFLDPVKLNAPALDIKWCTDALFSGNDYH